MKKCPHEHYLDYEEREDLKRKGWDYYNNEEDPERKAYYVLQFIIRSHYWRARIGIENNKRACTILKKIRGKYYYPSYRLDIDHYTCHWIYSVGKKILPKEVIDSLKKDYGYVSKKSKYMTCGNSMYAIHDMW